jgi:hypothetical protein
LGLSGSVVRRPNWATWLQVVAVIVINLVAGAAIFGARDDHKRGSEG